MQGSMWSVNHWGSHPNNGNDDCFTGDDFDTLEQALASELYLHAPHDVKFIEIDGPIESKHHQVIANPNYSARECRMQDAADLSERAMQAGMAFGVQGFNDEMGYDSEEPWGETNSAF